MGEPGYDREFFEGYQQTAIYQGVRSSAEVVVPLVVQLLHPRSVVDVGCGTGTWLKVFEEQGVSDFCGLDGDYVGEALEIPTDHFVPADLRMGVTLDRRFDLAVSLEVAEHLPEESAADFVREPHAPCTRRVVLRGDSTSGRDRARQRAMARLLAGALPQVQLRGRGLRSPEDMGEPERTGVVRAELAAVRRAGPSRDAYRS